MYKVSSGKRVSTNTVVVGTIVEVCTSTVSSTRA
jgi:hypothetical protein